MFGNGIVHRIGAREPVVENETLGENKCHELRGGSLM